MSETIVKVENISKKFCKNLKRSLWYGMKDLGSEILGKNHGGNGQLRKDEFWAVKDVSFELKRGECLGLIGHNGAGKTTLLRMLNGLIKPDGGRIEMHGRVGALIALGAGFNPILTGRENIYVNGAVLGFSKKEISEKFDNIVDFAEIGDFIDAPVQSYSSGMQVRLGFAIAAQMEPDILLIDEILAVGDVGFRAKCYNTIYEIVKNSAVIFVSHALPQISRLSSKAIVMNHGRIKFCGNDVPKGIGEYLDLFSSQKHKVVEFGKSRITNISLSAEKNNGYYEISFGEDLTVEFDSIIERKFNKLEISLTFLSQSFDIVAQCNSKNSGNEIINDSSKMRISFKIPKLNLSPGRYYISLSIIDAITNNIICWHHTFTTLKVTGYFWGGAPIQYIGEWYKQ